MQPSTTEGGQIAANQPHGAAVDPMAAQLAMDLDPDNRKAEELRMLLMGFLTGMSIAGIFLLYIVLESAKLMP